TPQAMLRVAPEQLLEALTRHLGIIDSIVDELWIDDPVEILKVALVSDVQVFRQAIERVRCAGHCSGERFNIKKVAALKVRFLPSFSLAARSVLMRRLGESVEG